MASRAPSVVISAEIKDSGSQLTLTSHLGKKLVIAGQLHRTNLFKQREHLRADLETFRTSIGSDLEYPSWDEITQAVRCLHRRGQILAWQLFGEQCREVQDLCSEAIPFWNLHRMPPKLIEVESRLEDIIPVELLPLFDLSDPPEIRDIRTLAEVMHRFVGFTAIVKRTLTDVPLSTDPVLENDPKLPVKFFMHAELTGALQEAEFFRRNEAHIDLEGPWPTEEITEEDFPRRLAEHLWNPAPRFDGVERRPPDQVQHFSCHCDTRRNSSENHYLKLAPRIGLERKATIGDLQSHFTNLQVSVGRPKGAVFPLVFFNACGSSVIDPTQTASFPSLLLKNRNRGFIGTESNVPDRFAASFSAQFYMALLKGRLLGEAVYHARWQMLERYRNPLGLLYTIYADPDIHVRKVIP